MRRAPAPARGLEAAVQQIKDAVQEIDAIGVQVKDLDTGLLDFPCQLGEEIVLLCWKMGEARITHWHTIEAGFRGGSRSMNGSCATGRKSRIRTFSPGKSATLSLGTSTSGRDASLARTFKPTPYPAARSRRIPTESGPNRSAPFVS